MLSKLIKYELKDASHSLFPIGLGMAILSVISALMVGSATKGFDLSRLPFYPLLSGLVGLLTFICVIAVVVICLSPTSAASTACSVIGAIWKCPCP